MLNFKTQKFLLFKVIVLFLIYAVFILNLSLFVFKSFKSNDNIKKLQTHNKVQVTQDIHYPHSFIDDQEFFTRTSYHFIEPKSTLIGTLEKIKVPKQDIFEILNLIIKNDILRPHQLRENTELIIEWMMIDQQEMPIIITVVESALKHVVFTKKNNRWGFDIKNFDVDIYTVSFSGVVENSLWESCEKQKVDPILISQFADIFAWQLDFVREVKKGDKWRFVVEQKKVKGQPYGWGRILIAEYINQGKSYVGVLYPQDSHKASYYSLDGSSLKKMFLKTPVKYARITSRFSKARFHPILKVKRPHNGVDYAAPIGTPIMAVGSGKVVFAGYKNNEAGIMVKIRHNAVYSSAYLHMQKVAKGIRVGKYVEQGEIIGYVGKTGLATAPHCHFSFYKNNVYVDPLKIQFPSADPVPHDKLSEFMGIAHNLLSLLPDWKLAQVLEDNTINTL